MVVFFCENLTKIIMIPYLDLISLILKELIVRDNILIVDDDQDSLMLLESILKEDGYKVRLSDNGEEALNLIKKEKPNLILLDITMPIMDGYTLCKKILGVEDFSHIPIIFLSSKSNSEEIVKGFEVGAVDYVTKPFNHYELLARVKTHLKLIYTQEDLDNALDQVKKLSGLLPICANCKNIRDENGDWTKLEKYINDNSEADFTHGICPTCVTELYPQFSDKNKK